MPVGWPFQAVPSGGLARPESSRGEIPTHATPFSKSQGVPLSRESGDSM